MNKKISEITSNGDVIYIDNDNFGGNEEQTITRTITESVQNIYSFNFGHDLGISVTAGLNKSFGFGDLNINLELNFDYDEKIGKTHTQSNEKEVTFPCQSPAGKHILCKAYSSDYKVLVPYTVYIKYFLKIIFLLSEKIYFKEDSLLY